MILTFTIDEITEKEADDISEEIIIFCRDKLGILVSDYTVET